MPKLIQKFEVNEKGSDWVVGDLHGHLRTLIAKLDEVGFDKTRDRLFVVGDLVDRGHFCPELLELLAEDWFFSCYGNHERMMWDYFIDEHYTHWRTTYGQWVDDHHYTEEQIGHLAQIAYDIMPLAMEVKGKDGKTYGIIHADVPGNDWSALSLDDENLAIWNRDRALMAQNPDYWAEHAPDVKGIDVVFHGHTPTRRAPLKFKNSVYLDTAVFSTGELQVIKFGEEGSHVIGN